MKIKFIKSYAVQGDAEGLPVYKAGEVYEFLGFAPESYAHKYVRLGLAEVYVAPVVKSTPVVKPAPAVEPVVEAYAVPVEDKTLTSPAKPAGQFGKTGIKGYYSK